MDELRGRRGTWWCLVWLAWQMASVPMRTIFNCEAGWSRDVGYKVGIPAGRRERAGVSGVPVACIYMIMDMGLTGLRVL